VIGFQNSFADKLGKQFDTTVIKLVITVKMCRYTTL